MLLKSSIDNIKKLVKSGNVLTSDEERYCYAQDSTNIKEAVNMPDAVVFVESVEDVQRVLVYANKNRIPVISRGAGTNMVGACTCPKGGIVMNFSKMNKILEFSPENMSMRVQPGAVLGDIKSLAESKGLFYPPDPSNFKVSTIGGSIAQSSGGAMAFKYGTTKDYITSLTVVLADGTLMKLGAGTVKDAVGYHLNQLIIGSEGTLAIVVEAELKLIPKPNCLRTVIGYFDSFDKAVEGVNGIIKEQVFPATIDFMDNNSIRTVENFYPTGLKTDMNALLLIDIDGFSSSLDEQQKRVQEALMQAGAALIDINDGDKVWTARRSSFAATAQLAPDVVSDDIIVPRTNLAKMINACKDICDKYGLKVCIVGHVGDGNIHPQIALDLENDAEFKNYIKAKSEMYEMAISLGGTISAEHGVGAEKISYLDSTLDKNAINFMHQIKKMFDPNNILNPDKIFRMQEEL